MTESKYAPSYISDAAKGLVEASSNGGLKPRSAEMPMSKATRPTGLDGKQLTKRQANDEKRLTG